MSLLKRGGNVWWSYFYADGIRHQYSTGTSNRKQAETIESQAQGRSQQPPVSDRAGRPGSEVRRTRRPFMASGSVRPHHIYHLKFLLPFFSETPVLRVTKSLADEFRKVRLAANKSIKDATINRDLSVLRHILYWAVDEQLLAANPLARMKMARERRTRRQVLSIAEEQAAARLGQGPPLRHGRHGTRHRHAARRDHQPALGGHRLLSESAVRDALQNPGRRIPRDPSDCAAARSICSKTAKPRAS